MLFMGKNCARITYGQVNILVEKLTIYFWNRLTNFLRSLKKSMRNFKKIRCEFQTSGYLALLKPCSVAGCVECLNISTWCCFSHGAGSLRARRLPPKISGKANKSILTTYIFQPPIASDKNVWSIFQPIYSFHHKLYVRNFLSINNTVQHIFNGKRCISKIQLTFWFSTLLSRLAFHKRQQRQEYLELFLTFE